MLDDDLIVSHLYNIALGKIEILEGRNTYTIYECARTGVKIAHRESVGAEVNDAMLARNSTISDGVVCTVSTAHETLTEAAAALMCLALSGAHRHKYHTMFRLSNSRQEFVDLVIIWSLRT